MMQVTAPPNIIIYFNTNVSVSLL